MGSVLLLSDSSLGVCEYECMSRYDCVRCRFFYIPIRRLPVPCASHCVCVYMYVCIHSSKPTNRIINRIKKRREGASEKVNELRRWEFGWNKEAGHQTLQLVAQQHSYSSSHTPLCRFVFYIYTAYYTHGHIHSLTH